MTGGSDVRGCWGRGGVGGIRHCRYVDCRVWCGVVSWCELGGTTNRFNSRRTLIAHSVPQ